MPVAIPPALLDRPLTLSSIGLALVVIFIGLLVGGVGVGAVLLAPSLNYFAQIPFPAAISASMMAYIATGVVGTAIYARRGSIDWQLLRWVTGGALPGAFLGAYLLPLVSGAWLEIGIGLVAAFSGGYALWCRGQGRGARWQQPILLLVVGLVVGIISSLTGNGGPVLLIPLLIGLNMPVLAAVGLAQAVQIPIGIAATTGNLLYGEVNLALGAILGLLLAAGAGTGAWLIHYLPKAVITRLVAIFLLLAGILILIKPLLRY